MQSVHSGVLWDFYDGDRIMTEDDVMRWKDEKHGSGSQHDTREVASSFHHVRTELIGPKRQNLQSNLKQLDYEKIGYANWYCIIQTQVFFFPGTPTPALWCCLEPLAGCTKWQQILTRDSALSWLFDQLLTCLCEPWFQRTRSCHDQTLEISNSRVLSCRQEEVTAVND